MTSQIDQNGVAVGNDVFAVLQDWHLSVGVQRQKRGLLMFTGSEVDENGFMGDARQTGKQLNPMSVSGERECVNSDDFRHGSFLVGEWVWWIGADQPKHSDERFWR